MRLTAFLKSRRNVFLIAVLLLLFVVAAIIVFVAIFPTPNSLRQQKAITSIVKPKFELYAEIKEMVKETKIITINQLGTIRILRIKIDDEGKIKDSVTRKSLKIDNLTIGKRIVVISEKALEGNVLNSTEMLQEIRVLDSAYIPGSNIEKGTNYKSKNSGSVIFP